MTCPCCGGEWEGKLKPEAVDAIKCLANGYKVVEMREGDTHRLKFKVGEKGYACTNAHLEYSKG